MLKAICPACKRQVYLCDRMLGSQLILDPSIKVWAPIGRRNWQDQPVEDAVESTMAYAEHKAVCRANKK